MIPSVVDELLARDDVTVSIGGVVHKIPVREALTDPRANIDDALARAGGHYFYVGQLRAQATMLRERADRAKSEMFNALAQEKRDEAKGVKITEKEIDQHVRSHKDYLAVCDAQTRAAYDEDLLMVVLRAIEIRVDAMRTIAATRRVEQDMNRVPTAQPSYPGYPSSPPVR